MSKLYGREVLIVEDHPLMLIEIADALSKVGAKPLTAANLQQALIVLEHDKLAAAIIDHLPNGDSSILCEKLDEKKVPFVIYSGRRNGHCANAILIEKTASTEQLIATVEHLVIAPDPSRSRIQQHV